MSFLHVLFLTCFLGTNTLVLSSPRVWLPSHQLALTNQSSISTIALYLPYSSIVSCQTWHTSLQAERPLSTSCWLGHYWDSMPETIGCSLITPCQCHLLSLQSQHHQPIWKVSILTASDCRSSRGPYSVGCPINDNTLKDVWAPSRTCPLD